MIMLMKNFTRLHEAKRTALQQQAAQIRSAYTKQLPAKTSLKGAFISQKRVLYFHIVTEKSFCSLDDLRRP